MGVAPVAVWFTFHLVASPFRLILAAAAFCSLLLFCRFPPNAPSEGS